LLAYQHGNQDIAKGINGYKFDFNTVDAVLEYDIKVRNFTVRPGINFRNAQYDDSRYANISRSEGFINGKKNLLNYAGSVRAEYRFKEILKLIAAFRLDKYDHPEKMYLSYQIAPGVKISDKHFLRAVCSRSYRGPNFYNSYNSQSILIGTSPLPTYAVINGNPELELLEIDLVEIGYRSKITENFHVDLDLFRQTANNFSYMIGQKTVSTDGRIAIPQTIENINMKAIQNGLTISANYVYKKIQAKPAITIQHTSLKDAPRYRQSVNKNPAQNVQMVYDSAHTGTPGIIAGLYLNYQLFSKWNLNTTAYYFSGYKYNNLYTLVGPGKGVNGYVNIPGKLLINLKLSYKPVEPLELFVNARNITNDKSYEFAQTDKTLMMFFAGLNYSF
jgi:iron complex outermembrane receptor protein